jgi:hypothetical protein
MMIKQQQQSTPPPMKNGVLPDVSLDCSDVLGGAGESEGAGESPGSGAGDGEDVGSAVDPLLIFVVCVWLHVALMGESCAAPTDMSIPHI